MPELSFVPRVFDPELMRYAAESFNCKDFDYAGWIANHRNIMYAIDMNVGLAHYEYPGVFSVHWFYRARGKDALDLAFSMIGDLFDNRGAQILRGIIKEEDRKGRWLIKQIGFKSTGIFDNQGTMEDVLCLTKEDFLRRREERYGSSS